MKTSLAESVCINYSSNTTSRVKRKLQYIAVLLLLILAPVANLLAQVTETFNTSGSFTVPAGVTSITVGMLGRWRRWRYQVNKCVAGGGGGGAYSSSVIAVTAGDVFNYVVGNGGTSVLLLLQVAIPGLVLQQQ